MAKKLPIFTIDIEDWNYGLHIDKKGHNSKESLWWLLYLLQDYDITGIFYVTKIFLDEYPEFIDPLKYSRHIIKKHGVYHYRGEKSDRDPYANLGMTGGFYFRFFPLWFTKWQVIKHGIFYCHPHDFDEDHPRCRNWLLNIKRHIGLKTARKKLLRLVQEVKFGSP